VIKDFETPPPFRQLTNDQRLKAKRHLLADVADDSRPRRVHSRKVVPSVRLAFAVVAVAAASFSLGAFVYTASGSDVASVESPGFLPATGWNEISTGTIPMEKGPTAIAATVPLASENGPVGTFPTQTLSTLPDNGIVFYAIIQLRGQVSGVDSGYPATQLPLQLSNAEIEPIWEGQPNSDVPEYIITAAVGNYNLAVYCFFGTQHPSAAQLTSAQDELNLLQVPSA
jgi:hypothetical protein